MQCNFLLAWLLFVPLLPACAQPAGSSEASLTIMLQEVNALRENGCRCPDGKFYKPAPPLAWNEQLAAAAALHAKDMNRRGFFNHVNPDGKDYADRAGAAGYDWTVVGENIAMGYHTEKEVVAAWRKSRDHCINLMQADFREMGAARSGKYWVQNLGAR